MTPGDQSNETRHRQPRQDDEHRGRWQQAREQRRQFIDEVKTARDRAREERLEQSRRAPDDAQPIWFRLREPRGRGRNALSYAQIVAAAIALADAEGPKAITMRKIAQALGVGTMSLYWYVPSKDDLIELMVDEIQGEGETPEPTGDWRADLVALARARRQIMLRHPWLLTFVGMGPPRGPNAVSTVERALSLLDGLALPIAETIRIIMTVDTFVSGFSLREQLEEEERRVWAEAGPIEDLGAFYLRMLEERGSYPHLVALMRSGVDPDDPATRDERFEFGLACLLDGIARRIEQRR